MLFDKLKIRDVSFRNRIAVSSMCQYSSYEGFVNEWHMVHLASRAVGGAGLVMTEAAAVEECGRITPYDLGIWKEEHILGLQRLTSMIHGHGAVPGIQLAHAGRKASVARPWEGGLPLKADEGGWSRIMAPTPISFDNGYPCPEELTIAGIEDIINFFAAATQRAVHSKFELIEIHAAHGYLLHEFLSPLTNKRADHYGGSFENRIRLLMKVVENVREIWPAKFPLLVRISATDWLSDGWDLEQSIALAHELKKAGVDLIDCSSGGLLPNVQIPTGPGFQVHFSERIRKETGIMTGAVGLITSAEQAEEIIRIGQADMVFLGRQLLRDPYWPIHAAEKLKEEIARPLQYERAFHK